MTTHRPALASGVLSVAAAAIAVGLVATVGPQRLALLATLVGLVPVAVGLELRHRGRGALGVALVALGTAVVAGAVALAAQSPLFVRIVELVPGLVGLYVLALALGSVWPGRERLLLSAGTGLILLSVLGAAVVYETTNQTLVLSGVLVVVAWDAAERAVNVGEQVGREARTVPPELLHSAATLGVGGVAIGVTWLVESADIQGLPLLALAGLLGVAFVLVVTLYN